MLSRMKKYAGLNRAELVENLMALEFKLAALSCAVATPDLATGQARVALADSEERIRAILHTAVEGIITIDERGRIETVNPAVEKIFGYPAAELHGENISRLMPSPYRQEHDGYLANYRRTGQARIIGMGREVTGQRKDGSCFPMELSVGEMRLAGGRMFTGIIRDITERKRLEKEILETTDREQRRIGQDLHDGLGQHLTGIELMVEVLQQKLAASSPQHAVRAAEITQYVREAITQTKMLARGLSPVVVESEGLMSALQELAANSEKIFRITCTFACPEPVPVNEHTIAVQLYRIAQEAVSNGIRHGQARRVEIQLRREAGQMVLRIQDNGRGFPSTSAENGGMGLRIMQYRAGMIGATLAIDPGPRGGVVVVCSLRVLPGASTEGKSPR